eukprot:TRINITY_DN161_c0_g2_i1.p1 TRINITY_DN161_c0_g2~~TRINITY_DN161_c0_g2_i1.p1  ORF type:complete len:268 (+),score=53.84 TRINITY_DN161_c0_g2_i1:114-917(+)
MNKNSVIICFLFVLLCINNITCQEGGGGGGIFIGGIGACFIVICSPCIIIYLIYIKCIARADKKEFKKQIIRYEENEKIQHKDAIISKIPESARWSGNYSQHNKNFNMVIDFEFEIKDEDNHYDEFDIKGTGQDSLGLFSVSGEGVIGKYQIFYYFNKKYTQKFNGKAGSSIHPLVYTGSQSANSSKSYMDGNWKFVGDPDQSGSFSLMNEDDQQELESIFDTSQNAKVNTASPTPGQFGNDYVTPGGEFGNETVHSPLVTDRTLNV